MRIMLGFFLLSLWSGQLQGPKSNQLAPRDITPADQEALVIAIQDEIYDYGYQKEFWGFETSGPHGPMAQFNVYIRPRLDAAQGGVEGVLIYKYLPFGEVIRPFVLASNGAVYLIGKPSSGFPWTQPSTKTIYMDDDEVCRYKHEWIRVQFELDLKPTQARIDAAVNRQKLRVGFSQLESSRARKR